MKILSLLLFGSLVLMACSEESSSNSKDQNSTEELVEVLPTNSIVVKDTHIVVHHEDHYNGCELNLALLSSENNDPEIDSLLYATCSFYALTHEELAHVVELLKAEGAGLCDMSYYVNYNANGIFDISYDKGYLGAYLSYSFSNVSLDLHEKKPFTLKDILRSDKVNELIQETNNRLNGHIEKAKLHPEMDELALDYFLGHEVDETTLEEFSLTKDGLIIYYDFEFPQMVKALEPNGVIQYTYEEAEEFLNMDLDVVKRLYGLNNEEAVL